MRKSGRVALSLLLLFVPLLFSCRTAMRDVQVKESVLLYEQALKALENQNFIIEAYEFHYPSENAVKTSVGSYISMQGRRAEINLTEDVLRKNPLRYAVIVDPSSILAKEKKRGDMYRLMMKGEQPWLNRRVLITLYKNTNQCYVQVYNDQRLLFGFRGNLYPGRKKERE